MFLIYHFCNFFLSNLLNKLYIGVSKKTEKSRKPEKKYNWKNRTKKKPIKILKKQAGSVWFGFGFISKKLKKPNRTRKNRKKTELNRAKPKKPSHTEKNRAKTGKTEPNRFELVFALKKPNRTETGWFDPVSVFLKNKFRFGYFFLIKPNRTENDYP